MATLLSKDQVKLSELNSDISRHSNFTVENKKKSLGKTVLKMWSQMFLKNGVSFHETTLKKRVKKKYIYIRMKTFTIFGGFWGQK